jgi:hypothetical protein
VWLGAVQRSRGIGMRDNFHDHHIKFFIVLQLEDYGLVQFLPLDITNEDSVGELLLFIDSAIQFGEDEDVKVPKVIASSESYIPSSNLLF